MIPPYLRGLVSHPLSTVVGSTPSIHGPFLMSQKTEGDPPTTRSPRVHLQVKLRVADGEAQGGNASDHEGET